jgi:hypothetical protein
MRAGAEKATLGPPAGRPVRCTKYSCIVPSYITLEMHMQDQKGHEVLIGKQNWSGLKE